MLAKCTRTFGGGYAREQNYVIIRELYPESHLFNELNFFGNFLKAQSLFVLVFFVSDVGTDDRGDGQTT